jgi:hypothetical protein
MTFNDHSVLSAVVSSLRLRDFVTKAVAATDDVAECADFPRPVCPVQKSMVALSLKNRGCSTEVGVSQVKPPPAIGLKFWL